MFWRGLQHFNNFANGAMDEFTFGATNVAREYLGLNGAYGVDTDSKLYTTGAYTETVVELATGAGALKKGLGKGAVTLLNHADDLADAAKAANKVADAAKAAENAGDLAKGADDAGSLLKPGEKCNLDEALKNQSSASLGDAQKPRTMDDPLPRKPGGEPMPDPDASGPHTQLGTAEGRKGPYRQGREFDANGNPVRDIDFTDHGRPNKHPNPHQHRYVPNPTGGTPQRGPAEPMTLE